MPLYTTDEGKPAIYHVLSIWNLIQLAIMMPYKNINKIEADMWGFDLASLKFQEMNKVYA